MWEKFHNATFIVFVIILIILYGYFIVKHLLDDNRECTIMSGECPDGTYCGVDGKCQKGLEDESCFLGLAQCQRPFNCYPDFRCHKF